MKDVIGPADMTQGNLTSFVADRFGNKISALALNGGWTQVPPGIYFDTPEFTISVWIYPMNVSSWSKIIDFGNGQSADNIVLGLSYSNNLKPYFEFHSGSDNVFQATSSKPVTFNQWQFLTATFNQKNATVYLNGTCVAKTNASSFTQQINLSRSRCFIGKSNWASNGYSFSYLDDLRFYNRSLTQEEIVELMNYYHNGTSLCFLNTYTIFLT
jgi:hypothetical protein